MKAARLLNILLLLSFLLTSCVPSTEEDAEIKEGLDESFVVSEGAQTEPPAPNCYKDVYEVPRESITRKLDILIIPDTSSSIKEERKKIAEGFDYFVGALPQGVDFNIGVILGHSKNSNKSGKLYKKNSSDPLVLKSSELSLSKIKESLSLKIHKPKTDGYSDGGEMGMASLLNALEGVNLQNLKDNGLLRDDAALAVIFVADEQDICAKAPEGITFKKDPQNGERKSFVKYCIDEEISWKEVTIGGDYTYKITPEILLNKLKEVKGDMPLVVGGVLYDKLSTIPTGNEDEIGHGYLETIRLAKGINVDLASGDYRDGLTRLGKLATTSFSAPQSFDLSVNPDPTSIKAFVDDALVAHTYDSLSNKVFLVNERSDTSRARIEYCNQENEENAAPMAVVLTDISEGTVPFTVNFNGTNSSDDKGIVSYELSVEGKKFSNDSGLFSYTFENAGSFKAVLKVIDAEGLSSTAEISIVSNPASISPVANFEITKSSERAPSVVTIDGTSSTDPDSEITTYELTFNGETINQSTPIFSLNLENGGDYSFSLTVTDSQGLINSKEGSFSLLNPLVSPVANLSVSPNSGRVPQTVTLDASLSSDADGTISKYDFYVDGALVQSSSNSSYSFNADISKAYEFKVIVTDNDSLTSEAISSATFLPALVAPVASLSANPLEGEVPFDITLNASGSSDADGEIVSYIYSDGENVVSTDSSSMTLTQEAPGTYTYSVEVIDNDGLKDVASVQVVAKPKVVTEESALSAYFKFNMIPKGEDNYDLELIYEGRSFNDKVITEAYYTIAGEIRVDVGRRVLGHVDVFPVQFNETDGPVDMTLTIVDELGGSETFTHSLNPNNPNPLVFVDAIEYAPNSIVLFSNHFHDPYNQLEDFNAFEIDYGDGSVIQVEDNFFQLTHSYASSGEYTIKITAEGQNGETYTTSELFSVTGTLEDFKFPLADFKVEKQEWAPGVRLYVDQSLSPNAPIMTYLWELGDGTTAYGPEVIHFYKAGGYDVTLTAILEDGTQSVVKRETIIMSDAPNVVSNLWCYDIGNLTLECELDAADKFNDLKTLFVNFDDNAENESFVLSKSVSGGFEVAKFTFTYDNPGTYDIAYLVETGRGEELLKLTQFSVTDTPGNEAPVAKLDCFNNNLFVDCNAFSSFDSDGFIAEYRINMGNGESFFSDQVFYDYPQEGSYEVELIVTDNLGLESRDSVIVDAFVDSFERPVAQIDCTSEGLVITCLGTSSYNPLGGSLLYKFTRDGIVVSSDSSFQFEVAERGSYEVTLTVENENGFTDQVTEIVDASENPEDLIFADLECNRISLEEIRCSAGRTIGSSLNFQWFVNNELNSSTVDSVFISSASLEVVNVKLLVSNEFFTKELTAEIEINAPTPEANFSYSVGFDKVLRVDGSSSFVEGLRAETFRWSINGEFFLESGYPILELGTEGVDGSTVNLEVVYENTEVRNVSKVINLQEFDLFPDIKISHSQAKGGASREVDLSFNVEKGTIDDKSFYWLVDGARAPGSDNLSNLAYVFESRGEKSIALVVSDGNSERVYDYNFLIEEISFNTALEGSYNLGDRIILYFDNFDPEDKTATLFSGDLEFIVASDNRNPMRVGMVLPYSEDMFGERTFEFSLDGSTYNFSSVLLEPVYSDNPVEDSLANLSLMVENFENKIIEAGEDPVLASEISSTLNLQIEEFIRGPDFDVIAKEFEFLTRINNERFNLTTSSIHPVNLIESIFNLFSSKAYANSYEENRSSAQRCDRVFGLLEDSKEAFDIISLSVSLTSSIGSLVAASLVVYPPGAPAAAGVVAFLTALSTVSAITVSIESIIRAIITVSKLEDCVSNVVFPLTEESMLESGLLNINKLNLPINSQGKEFFGRGLEGDFSVTVPFGKFFNERINFNSPLYKKIKSTKDNFDPGFVKAGTIGGVDGIYKGLIEYVEENSSFKIQNIFKGAFLTFLPSVVNAIFSEKIVSSKYEALQINNEVIDMEIGEDFSFSTNNGQNLFVDYSGGSRLIRVTGENKNINSAILNISLSADLLNKPYVIENLPFELSIVNPCDGEQLIVTKEGGVVSRDVQARLSGNVSISSGSTVCGNSEIKGPQSGAFINVFNDSFIKDSTLISSQSNMIIDGTKVTNSEVRGCSKISNSSLGKSAVAGGEIHNSLIFQTRAFTDSCISKLNIKDSKVTFSNLSSDNELLIGGNYIFTRVKAKNSIFNRSVEGVSSINLVSSEAFEENFLNTIINPVGIIEITGSPKIIDTEISVNKSATLSIGGDVSFEGQSELIQTRKSGTIRDLTLINTTVIGNIGIDNGVFKNSTFTSFGSMTGENYNVDSCQVRVETSISGLTCSNTDFVTADVIMSGATISSSEQILSKKIGPNAFVVGSEVNIGGTIGGNVFNSRISALNYLGTLGDLSNQSCLGTDSPFILACEPR